MNLQNSVSRGFLAIEFVVALSIATRTVKADEPRLRPALSERARTVDMAESTVVNEPQLAIDLKTLSQRTEDVIKQRDSLGRELVAVLSNEQSQDYERIAAARLLGKLQYAPAISVLIRYIDLEPSKYSEATGAPIAGALAQFGDAAIPPVIHAYLNHKNDFQPEVDPTELRLFYAIDRRVMENARTFIKGIAVTDLERMQDWERAVKIYNFLEFASQQSK